MAAEIQYKLSPHRGMALRGFDRRGAAAALHHTSASALQVTGVTRDAADFTVCVLWDADNFFDHYSIKYLPDFNFTGMTLDFDLATTNLQWIESLKFPSIDWPYIDYIDAIGQSGRVRLADYITTRTGRANATITYTVNTPSITIFDRVTLTCQRFHWDLIIPGKQSVTFNFFNYHGTGFSHTLILGANTYHYIQLAGDSSTAVAAGLASAASADANVIATPSTNTIVLTGRVSNPAAAVHVQAPDDNGPDDLWLITAAADVSIAQYFVDAINGTAWDVGVPVKLTATRSSATFTVTANGSNYGAATDGNMTTLYEQHKNSNTYLTPAGATKFSGATDPSTVHITIPLHTAGLESMRQMWVTFAPQLADSAAYTAAEFTVAISNWTVTDPGSIRALKIAHPLKSARVLSRDWNSLKYAGSGWAEEAGFFTHGFAHVTSHSGDTITINYSCQYTHDLHLGTSLYLDRGIVNVSLDGDTSTPLDTFCRAEPSIQTRRRLRQSVPAGQHRVVITHSGTKHVAAGAWDIDSTGYAFYFDFLEAAVLDDMQDPLNTYSDRSAASDWDTDHGYKQSPQRLVNSMDRCGMHGDWNHYAGVFWWANRIRRGGDFHHATITFTGWAGLAGGGVAKLQFGGSTQGDVTATYLPKQSFPADTNDQVAAHFAYYINQLLVGVWASVSSNVLTITSRSPIYDFTFWAFTDSSGGPVGSVAVTGDLRAGNEGTWEIDPTAVHTLNRAATDWHADFWSEIHAKGWTATCAFSQELLNAPDNPPTAVWTQRYASGAAVLTATGFGTEGAGFIDVISGSNVTVNGHGYISGNAVNITKADHTASAVYYITVTGTNTFTLGTRISGTIGYTPTAGDIINRNLQTSQCAFSATVSNYYRGAHKEMAGLMNAAGLTPWLQFGEILHWFFSDRAFLPISNATNASPIAITCTAHGLTTGDSVILSGAKGNTGANGTWPITVTGANTFTLTGSAGTGTYTTGGLATGGSMALYDADQTAAATTALGRSLASFNHQDSDPSINAYADANFLRDRIKAYIDAIRTYVLGFYAGAKFEILWPYDVCYKQAYWNDEYPYPQGGRLNRYINLPSQYSTKSGSGLDRIKMEALSWGVSYRNLDLAKETIQFPYTVLTWSKADTRSLSPWNNGGCPWVLEHVFHRKQVTPHVNFWAYDHMCLFSWPLALPELLPVARVV